MAKYTESITDYFDDQTRKQYEIHDSSDYSRFRGSTPVLVTFYHQNNSNTTTDKGFGNVYNNIGDESPKRYNKVLNIPLFDIDKTSFELSDEDIGLKGDSTGKATMIPDTIEPIPEDFITFNFQNHRYMYKVTNVELDNIKSNNYFEIGFKYNREYDDEIEDQVIDTYQCIYENIGSDERSVLRITELDKLKELESIYKTMANEYLNCYYDKLCNTVILEYDESLYYDPCLIEFIKRNKLFQFEYDLNSYCFDHIIPVEKNFRLRYVNSIYNAMEFQKNEYQLLYRPIRINDVITYFYKSGLKYYNMQLYIGKCKELFTFDYNKIINNVEDYQNILNYYFDNKLDKKSSDELCNMIIEKFNNYACDISVKDFLFIPLIMYIIKKLMHNININNITDFNTKGGKLDV